MTVENASHIGVLWSSQLFRWFKLLSMFVRISNKNLSSNHTWRKYICYFFFVFAGVHVCCDLKRDSKAVLLNWRRLENQYEKRLRDPVQIRCWLNRSLIDYTVKKNCNLIGSFVKTLNQLHSKSCHIALYIVA